MKDEQRIMQTRTERGIAMVLALFLMSALSVLGASMMFLSQTETYATLNYRMMSQARYAAEAGIQRTSNFLLDTNLYAPPHTGVGGDSIDDNYDITASPVKCKVGATLCTAGSSITLSSTAANSNYPDATKKTAFAASAGGSLTAGSATLTYTTVATLLTMQYFESYSGTSVVQTWRIESTGAVRGTRNATVEVMALVETPKVPASGYAAFATADVCGALTLSGHLSTDSYDSTSMSGATTPTAAGTVSTSGGSVGTNGNLTLNGGADVGGNLYTPRTGVGSCNASAANAFTGNVDHVDSIVPLPAVVKYPDPAMPTFVVADPVTLNSAATLASACATFGLSAPVCQVTGSTLKLDATTATGSEIRLPELTVNGSFTLQIVSGSPNKYDLNSLRLVGGAAIQVSSTTSSTAAVVNIVGKDKDGGDLARPLDLAGGSQAAPACTGCSNYDASLLKFVYAGQGELDLLGNSAMVGTVYAPNAYVHLGGNYALYGSVISGLMDNGAGSPVIHYDRRLSHDLYMPGHPAAGTFTWKRAS
jgi:Tfp pilus assembly protein PilX